jgi:hypothetical protein
MAHPLQLPWRGCRLQAWVPVKYTLSYLRRAMDLITISFVFPYFPLHCVTGGAGKIDFLAVYNFLSNLELKR